MGAVYVDMLPLILGAMLLPIWIIIVLMLLSEEKGLLKGAAFVAGVTTARLVQGLLFGFVFTGITSGGADSGPSVVVSTLLLVLGVLLLIAGYKKWSNEPDPDAPPPKVLASLAGMSPLKAFGMGVLLVLIAAKLWVFTFAALSTIAAAGLSRTSSVIAYLLFVLSAQSLIILPVLAYAIAPDWAGKTFGGVREWLDRNNRVIVILASLVFGLLFLWNGLAGLLG